MKKLYSGIFSWKIFGEKARIGDRLSIKNNPDMKFGEMVRSESGVFVFFPTVDSFPENSNREEVQKAIDDINLKFSELNVLFNGEGSK